MVEEKDVNMEGIKLFEPILFKDNRGSFMEFYNQKKMNTELHQDIQFVQDNISCSHKNVLRGLHFQARPFEQGKLIQVLRGKVLDVVVDIRRNSKTYGKHLKFELSGDNLKQLWIPPGFAHGFISLEDNTLFSYKCTNPYSKDHEMDLLWNDLNLNIEWNIKNPIISEKDKNAKEFANFISPF